MNRIIQGLALAALVSAAHAAPGDAYPAGGAPASLTAKQTYADMHANEANTQSVNAFPAGGAPAWLTAKQTHADIHAGDAKNQAGDAFPGHAAGD